MCHNTINLSVVTPEHGRVVADQRLKTTVRIIKIINNECGRGQLIARGVH